MPQYELMYLLGSHVTDDEVPKISANILKFAEDFGATQIKESQLGKKKLAYPIGKTRNGHYVVVNFVIDAAKVNELDAKIRTQDQAIIRYLLVNLEEHLKRQAKDLAAQAKLNRRIPTAETAETAGKDTPAPAKKEKPLDSASLLDINQEELDKKIEAALSEDLTK